MLLRWTGPRLSLLSALLLAVALSWGGPAGFGGAEAVKIAAESGWVPVSGSLQQRGPPAESAPRFGSRITKPRLSRVESTTAAASTTTVPRTLTTTPKPTATSASRARPPRQGPADEPEEETKSLAQQVADGKYGLIQNELFSSGAPSRPGILSYAANLEVPRDTADNLGGLRPDEIWLSEGHVLVLSGGNLGSEGHWEPIDNYQAPPRQVKIPPNPSVPPPFPVQLQDGGPTGFVTSNGTLPFKYGPPPPGNFETGNGIIPPAYPNQPFPHSNGPQFPPIPPLFRQENLTQDDDDPSIFYPPPYDFSYQQDNSSLVPPGPIVPGIVLPPPPNFFAPANKSALPQLFVPPDAYGPPLRPPPPPYPNEIDVISSRPPDVHVTQAPPEENEIAAVPGYPYKEPNVFFHHHGSPVLNVVKNVTRVQVSPPEKLIVYELPGIPPLPRGRTLVSSTPSPTALYYTLPPEPQIQLTIYSATPAPKVKQHHTQTFFANAPRPRPFTSPKPALYYDVPITSTPKSVHLYPDTTTPAPLTTTPRITKKPKPITTTTEPPNFFPSSIGYDFPIKYAPPTTTPVPEFHSRAPKGGRYFPVRDDYFYNSYVTPSPPPRYVPPQPPPRPNFPDYFYDQRRPADPVYYNHPRPDSAAAAFFFPSPQRRPVYQTPAPTFDNLFFPVTTRRPALGRPDLGFYYGPPKHNPQQQPVVSTTQNPIFNGLYTRHEEKFMDDITKGYFNVFGQRLTTPLPPTEPIPLHGDTRVNYKHPLPPINPESEFIDVRNGGRDPSVVSYQLPGRGQRGPSHYFFLTPRQLSGDNRAREEENVRSPRASVTPRQLSGDHRAREEENVRSPRASVTTAPRPPVTHNSKVHT